MKQVDLETTAGTIRVELDEEKAPETVKNFLTNVENGHYDNTVFHRVIKGFMLSINTCPKPEHETCVAPSRRRAKS